MKQQFAAKHPWTILAAGAAIQVLTGLPAAWGVFQQPVMEEYGLSEQGAGYAFAQGWGVVACYAGLTFCYSALAAVLPSLSTDLFGFPHAGVNYGFLALGQSVGSLAFPFAANFFGLEVGRHWMAVAAAGAGFACIRALRPVEPFAGRGQRGVDRTC